LPIAAGQHIQLALLAFRLIVAIALLPFALDWRSPLLASLRPAALTALIALPLLLVAIDGPALWQASASRIRRVLSVIAVATASLLTTLWHELAFRHRRMQVMASDPAQLERLGGHFHHRLSRSGRASRPDRPPRHWWRFHRDPQHRRTLARRHPPRDRRLAGHAPAPRLATALDRNRPGGRRSLAIVAAAAAAAADRLDRRCRPVCASASRV
jgi:hypothetical protein